MTTQKIYQLPVEITNWKFDGADRDQLQLGIRGRHRRPARISTRRASSSSGTPPTRLDWTQELFEDNPMGMSDETIPIYGSPFWDKMTEKEKDWLRLQPAVPLRSGSSCTASRAR